MRTAKSPLIASAAAVLSLGLLGFSAPAHAAPVEGNTPASASTSTSGDVVSQEMVSEDGATYEVNWDQQTGQIDIYEGTSKIGETTMEEVQAEYAALAEQGEGAPMATASANTCDYVMAGAGTANSALWAAAGLTAVAPPAAAVAAGAGLVTTGIITAGGLAAC